MTDNTYLQKTSEKYYNGQLNDEQEEPPRRITWKRIVILLFILIVLVGIMSVIVYRNFMKSTYPMEYDEIVHKYAKEYDFDPSLVFAVIHTESNFNINAKSHADAMGLMQVTKEAFEWAQVRMGNSPDMDIEMLYDPETNIKYGTYILSLIREIFPKSDITTVLAAYNAGQGRVAGWLEDSQYSSDGINLENIPYPETKNYVEVIPQTQRIYKKLYKID